MSLAFISLMYGTFLRSTILAAYCGLLLWACRVKTAEMKHLLWRGVLMAFLLLPVLQIVAPPLRPASKTVLKVESAIGPALTPGSSGTERGARAERAISNAQRGSSDGEHWPAAILGAYLLVTCGLLARLGRGVSRLRSVVRGSEFIADPELHTLAHDAWLENGAGNRPRVRVSSHIVVPVAVDLDEDLILLPCSWRQWSEEKLRAVLMHETAHVKRGDPGAALVASITTCLFWFHPLAWFLRRQLTALAEEACDEIALRAVPCPERYARMLIEFAADVAHHNGRILEPASAAVHSSQIKKRLKRIFAVTGHAHTDRRGLRALAIAMLLPAFYLTAAARFDGMQTQSDPEDLTAQQVLDGYLNAGDAQQFTERLIQIIQEDPDSKLTYLTWVVLRPMGKFGTPENIAAVKAAWDESLAQNPDSAGAHWGVGICAERSDPERALSLFRQARELASGADTERYVQAIATVYTAAVMMDLHLGDPRFRMNDISMDLNTATKLRNEVETSNDPALLSAVGKALVSLSRSPGQDAQSKLGLDYLQRSVDLDRGNLKWKEALEAAKAEPARRRAFQALRNETETPTAIVRIGAGVANANLVKKVDPQYPPLALQARVQGTVEFNVVIGADGHVQSMELVRGHPLLVNAAKTAVEQRLYRPTLLKGKAVAVSTEVMVPFRLPE